MSLIGIGNVEQREREIAQREQQEQNECDDPSIETQVPDDFHRDLLAMPGHDADRRSTVRRSLEKAVKNL
jgi:hypothetical protein